MPNTPIRSAATGLAIALLAGAIAAPALAQDEAASATVAEVKAGVATGTVSMNGAILGPISGDEYLFSDGTDVITIDLDSSTAEADPPALTLMNIVGTVASDEIDVSEWSALEIFAPAVIRTPQEAMETFAGWIITQNSQAAVDAPDTATDPADGDVLTDE